MALVIPRLCFGGAERVMSGMANWWAAQGRDVTVITFDAAPPAYPLHPAVIRVALDGICPSFIPARPDWPAEAHNISRLKQALELCLERCSQRPLPVISFLSRMNMRVLLAARGLPCRVIISERVFPPCLPLLPEEEALRLRLYPEAFHIVLQTYDTWRHWGRAALPGGRISIIPNPAFPPADTERSSPTPLLLAVGRLERQKQFHLLIEMFASVAARIPPFRLAIVGEGSERPRLERLITRHQLQTRVTLAGETADPGALMRRAWCLALPSAFEGFPNVLLESMARGCPAVAFTCHSGPGEIIRQEVDGLLVPDGDRAGFQEALALMCGDGRLRHALASKAPHVLKRFSLKGIMSLWDELVEGRPAPSSAPLPYP